jgi:hypothetical protein
MGIGTGKGIGKKDWNSSSIVIATAVSPEIARMKAAHELCGNQEKIFKKVKLNILTLGVS